MKNLDYILDTFCDFPSVFTTQSGGEHYLSRLVDIESGILIYSVCPITWDQRAKILDGILSFTDIPDPRNLFVELNTATGETYYHL